jgi:hypothetical protein
MTHEKMRTIVLAAAAALAFAGTAEAQVTGKLVNPNVLLLVDSSGSMDWLVGHPESAGESWFEAQQACEDANDPGGLGVQRTSWQQLLDVMLGEIPSDQYHCFLETPEIRPAMQADTLQSSDVSTYISEYAEVTHNHFRAVACDDADWNAAYGQCIGETPSPAEYQIMASGHLCRLEIDGRPNYLSETATAPELCFDFHDKARQRQSNGILERYRTLARFGVMTYDNKPAPASLPPDAPLADEHDGLWNYGESRVWDCKQWFYGASQEGNVCTWNAGARTNSPNAVGRMVPISDDLEGTNGEVRKVLNTTEPLYCSPPGAMIDDAGYYIGNDPFMRPADGTGGSDLYFSCRPKIVIFISDGQPTADFEFPREYCSTADTPPEIAVTGTDKSGRDVHKCPWNASTVEVEQLADLVDFEVDGDDPVLLVVIGMNAGGKWEATPTDPGTYTGVDCNGVHTWQGKDIDNDGVDDTWDCVPPDPKCVQVGIPEHETACLAGEYHNDVTSTTEDAFLTPRQFLNQLALRGWPVELDVDASGSGYLTAPWRSDELEMCSDDPADPKFGNCGGETYEDEENGAIFVDTAQELAAVLDLILSKITATTATRTEVVTTNQVDQNLIGGLIEDSTGVAQYEFTSGFQVLGGMPWKGYLFRQGYSCVEDNTGGTPVGGFVAFHDWLTIQAAGGNRHIYTLDDAALAEVAYDGTTLIPGSDALIDFDTADSTGLNDCDLGGPTGVCEGETQILSLVKSHLYGEGASARAEHPLADIYNSTPAILGPPLERIAVSSYEEYKTQEYTEEGAGTPTKLMDRPPYLYVGTSDGVLHSFNVWGTSGNVEAWGYVPNALLGGLRMQYPITWDLETDPATSAVTGYTVPAMEDQPGIYQHIFGVDGSPVARDVLLYRDHNAAPSGSEAARWRSVVIGGLGKGGVGYYALDVTNPSAKPLLRWEISERSDGMEPGKAGNNPKNTFSQGSGFGLGIPLARPALAYVYLNDPIPGAATNSVHEEAVAILPGGYKNTETEGAETSTGVYIVSVTDGRLIRRLMPDLDDDICGAAHEGLTAQLIGEPAVPEGTRSATVADEAFMGDDRGRLWRIDMSDNDPDNWCVEMYFDTLLRYQFMYQDCIPDACCSGAHTPVTDACSTEMIAFHATDDEWGIDACTGNACPDVDYPFPRIPIINPPTIVQDRDRNNVIIFGTGQVDGLEILDHHRVFSLTERLSYNVGNATTASYVARGEPDINWWLGEPMTTAMESATPSEFATQIANMQETHVFFDAGSTQGDMWNLGEKMLGRPVVFEEVAYFTSYIPIDLDSMDACDSGGSRIWGVKFGASLTGPNTAMGSLLEFQKLEWDTNDDGIADTYGPFKDVFDQDGKGVLLTGLKVVRRPSCSGEPTFELVTQRALSQSEKPATPSSGTQQQFATETVKLTSRNAGFTTVLIDSWSLVFQ